MKVTIAKVTAGDGEQIQVEVQVPSEAIKIGQRDGEYSAVLEHMSAAYAIVDARLAEMNRRVVATNILSQKLVKDHPEAFIAFRQCIAALTGQMDPAERDAVLAAQRQVQEEMAKKAVADEVAVVQENLRKSGETDVKGPAGVTDLSAYRDGLKSKPPESA